MPTTIKVDDRDPSIIYSGHWRLTGYQDEYRKTSHKAFGAPVDAMFEFSGSSIRVFGSTTPANEGGPGVTLIIDDGDSITPFADSDSLDDGHLLFQTSNLADGVHTITVKPHDDAFWLDYFEVTLAEQIPTTSSTSTVGSPSPTFISASFPTPKTPKPSPSPLESKTPFLTSTPGTPSAPSSTQQPAITYTHGTTEDAKPVQHTSSSTLTVPPATSQIATPGPRTQTGAMIGAIIGGVVLVLAIQVILCVWCRRRRGATKAMTPFTAVVSTSEPAVHFIKFKGGTSDSTSTSCEHVAGESSTEPSIVGCAYPSLPSYISNPSSLPHALHGGDAPLPAYQEATGIV